MRNFTSLFWSRVSLIILVLVAGFIDHIYGQCDPPSLLPTPSCNQATELVCLQNACYSTGAPTADPHIGWCGAMTAIHNGQYFLFQATSTTVQINIHVDNCTGGGCGLQSGIINACPWTTANVLACHPGISSGGTMILFSAAMEVDSFYWLVIDGCNGQVCQYTIEHASGVFTPGIVEDLVGAYTDDDVVCQGQDNWTAVAQNEIAQAAGYLWTGFPWGSHTSTRYNMSDNPLDIPDNAQPGTYNICVRAFTGCDSTETAPCFSLTIVEIEDEDSPPVTLCPETLAAGVTWNGLTITAPGTYTRTFNTPEGCPYDSVKVFSAYPAVVPGPIDRVICEESYTYEGVTYTTGGTYTLMYDNASGNGCDSTANLNLTLVDIEVETDFVCEFGQFTLMSDVVNAVPDASGWVYQWYHNGFLVFQGPTFSTNLEGSYELIISRTINGVTCEFTASTNPLVIDLNDILPAAPVFQQVDSSFCEDDVGQFCVDFSDDAEFWFWTAPDGVLIFGDGNLCVTTDWSAALQGGMLCVRAANECGEGQETCFPVTVISEPVVDFTVADQVCVNTDATITFDGSAGPDVTYIWNFGAGAQIQAGGTGPGPHIVSWSSPGTKTISLQVTDPDCGTSTQSYDILIESLGSPVVNCNADVTSMTFEWSPVPGAIDYNVVVLSGPAGVLTGTSYTINGVTPGDTVEIEVTAVGSGACTSQSVVTSCIAQSCPPKDVQIILPADSICLGDVSGPLSLSATVDGVAATGTWSGPGVDPSTGIFDPHDPAAGAGQHQIVFTYTEGTCPYNEQAVIEVFENPTSTFMSDAAICIDNSTSVSYTGNASSGAAFNWDFGSAIVVNGSGIGPYELRWNSAGTYPVSLIVEENNCLSQVFMQDVEVQPAVVAPVIQCNPTTSSVTFQWNETANQNYDLTQLSGAPGTLNGNQFVVNGLTPGDSVAIELQVSGNGMCPPVILQASCVAQNCPTPTIMIDPVDDICLYPATGQVDLEVTVTNGSGTGVWSGAGIVDQAEGIFDPLMSGAGSHQITYNYTDQGCSFVGSITIDVFDPPVADISSTSLVLTCENGNALDLDGSGSTAPGPVSYLWSTSDGVIITPVDQQVITAGGPGTYQLLVTDLTSLCEDATTITLMKDDAAPDADAGPDALLDCNISFAVLGGSSSTGPSITYQWTTEGGVITSDSTEATITVIASGIYELVVTDMSNGCVSIDEVEVTADSIAPAAVLAVGDTLNCVTETTLVSALISPAGNMYTYQWTTSNGQIQSGAGTPEIVAGRPGIYHLLVINDGNGCQDSVSIEVFGDETVITGIDAAIDIPKCVGDVDGQIEILSILGGTQPFTYLWDNQSGGSGRLNLGPGTYTVTVTDANGCNLTETFTLPVPVAFSAEIGANLTRNVNETVSIMLQITGSPAIADVIWGGVAPPCPGCMQIEFPADTSGEVIVTVVDSNGCEATASLLLTVLRPRYVFVPTVFSPNGDNINDVFTIRGNTLTEIKAMRIFDRWGDLVYEELNVPANMAHGWDGTHNGKTLNPGVYVFMAELVHEDNLEEVIKGDVTLIR